MRSDQAAVPAGRLASLRRNDVPLPEARFVETSPVELALTPPEQIEAWLAVLGHPVDRARLRSRFVVVDLDDTLLHGSYTCPQLVRESSRGEGGAALPGFRYAEMRQSLWRKIRLGRGAGAYAHVSRRHHPALVAPRVLVRPNVALLSCLVWLQRAGVTLAMATATSKIRVDYLRSRLPILDVLFGARIVTADHLDERVAVAATQLEQPAASYCRTWQMSAELHRRRPHSILAKSPWAIATALDAPAYDLLVDDSAATARLLHKSGLGERLLWIASEALQPAYAVSVLAAIVARLTGAPAPSQLVPLKCSSLTADIALPEPEPVLIEDPWYYPLLHVRDRFGPAECDSHAMRAPAVG